MTRFRRWMFSLATVTMLVGFGTMHVGAMQCDYAAQSHGVADERYGYYCIGGGDGCSYCWEEIVVKG